MKIKSVEVRGFRGLREFNYEFNVDRTFLLFGLNGTGKSSFYQAMQFGLLGDLPPVSVLDDPGPEVYRHRSLDDADPAFVKVVILHNGQEEWVKRSITSKGEVISEYSSDVIAGYCEAEINSLCFLTRARFAEMIDAVDRDRWTRLSPLLGHEDLASFREGMRLLARNLKRDLDHKTLVASVQDASDNAARKREEFNKLAERVGTSTCTMDVLMELLQQLGIKVDSLEDLSSVPWDELEGGLPSGQQISEVTSSLRSLDAELNVVDDTPLSAEELEDVLKVLGEIGANPSLSHDLVHASFYHSALSVIRNYLTEPCPLCGLTPKDWNDVRTDVGSRADLVNQIHERQKAAIAVLSKALASVRRTRDRHEGAKELYGRLEMGHYLGKYETVADFLSLAHERLESQPPRGFSDQECTAARTAINELEAAARGLRAAVENDQSAYKVKLDRLTNSEEVKRFLEIQNWVLKYLEAESASREWRTKSAKLEAMDAVIGSLQHFNTVVDEAEADLSTSILQSIESEVARLFQLITRQDKLVPEIRREGSYGVLAAAIDIKDFHGLGPVSAREFLSEANRNALGLAILFAGLAFRSPRLQTLVLDDITHSADNLHRRGLAHMLVTDVCASRQVLILTHDRNWYDYMINALKNKADGLQVIDWSPDGLTTQADRWQSLLDAARGKITAMDTSGGNSLRMAMEQFVDAACETYRVRIPYRRTAEAIKFEEKRDCLVKEIENAWETGNGFIDPQNIALSTFKSSQRVANLASHFGSFSTWDQQDLIDALADVEDFVKLFICKQPTKKGICGGMARSLVHKSGGPNPCKHCRNEFLP